MKVDEKKDLLMSSLIGFEGIQHNNFWVRYESKTFGHLFVRAIKVSLLDMVMYMGKN